MDERVLFQAKCLCLLLYGSFRFRMPTPLLANIQQSGNRGNHSGRKQINCAVNPDDLGEELWSERNLQDTASGRGNPWDFYARFWGRNMLLKKLLHLSGESRVCNLKLAVRDQVETRGSWGLSLWTQERKRKGNQAWEVEGKQLSKEMEANDFESAIIVVETGEE